MSWSDRTYGFDERATRDGRPHGTYWIIAITFAITIVIWSFGGGAFGSGTQTTTSWFALRRSELFGYQIWRYVTYAFLHGDVGHIVFNMLILFFLGRILEGYFGTRRFVALYLAFAAAGALGFIVEPLFTDQPAHGAIGASGAVMGMVALLGSRFPQMQLLFWGVIPMRCWALAAILVGLDLLSIIAYQGRDGTAHSIHLAGAFAGFFHGYLWPKLDVRLSAAKEKVEAGKRRKEARRRERDDVEMDRILRKIADEGMDRLTPKERDFLLDQSERLKRRRQ